MMADSVPCDSMESFQSMVESGDSPPEVSLTTLYPPQQATQSGNPSKSTRKGARTFQLLWCEECGKGHTANCPTHGELLKIKDREIPSKAKLTIPHMLSLKGLGLSNNGINLYSVVARKIIQKRTMFGPFDAPLSDTEQQTEMQDKQLKFKVFGGGCGGLWLDQRDEDSCNWMIYVQAARYTEEVNMVAYQYKDKIYFTTTKVIAPNQELKVGYAEDYRVWMGADELPRLQADSDEDCGPEEMDDIQQEEWKCTLCRTNFMTFEELEEHACSSQKSAKEKSKAKSRRKGRPMKRIHGKLVTTRSAAKRKERLSAASVASKKRKPLPKIRPTKVPKPVFECVYCSKAICGENVYKVHLSIHTGKKPFVCDHTGCNKGFTSKYKLDRHALIHSDTKNFKCAYCERSFNRKDHLKIHLAVHDQNRKPNMCDICGKEYSSNITFKTHMAFHSAEAGEKVCKICNKEFNTKEDLIFHIRVHSGSRLAKMPSDKHQNCPYCDKKFFTKKDVKRHLIVHTKKKDYLCQFCPQRFGRKDHLTRHIRATHVTSNGLNGEESAEPVAVQSPSLEKDNTPQAPAGPPEPVQPVEESVHVTNAPFTPVVVNPSNRISVTPYQVPPPGPGPSSGEINILDPVSGIASSQQLIPHLTPMAVYATGPHVLGGSNSPSVPPPPILHPSAPQPHPLPCTNPNLGQPMPPPVNQMRSFPPPPNTDFQHGFNQRINTLYNNKFCNPSQSLEAMVGYIETLKFLENLPTPPHGHPIPNPPPSPYTSGYLVPPDVHIPRPSPTFPQQPLVPPQISSQPHSQLTMLSQHSVHTGGSLPQHTSPLLSPHNVQPSHHHTQQQQQPLPPLTQHTQRYQ